MRMLINDKEGGVAFLNDNNEIDTTHHPENNIAHMSRNSARYNGVFSISATGHWGFLMPPGGTKGALISAPGHRCPYLPRSTNVPRGTNWCPGAVRALRTAPGH